MGKSGTATDAPSAGAASTGKRKSNSSGEQTRRRIVDATLETLRVEGIAGTSARAIARAGDFNQALIFYHFGSVSDAIVAAVGHMSDERLARHRTELAEASSLPDLIKVAKALHAEDAANDRMTVLTHAFAGAIGDPEMGAKLYAQFEPWTELLRESIDRVVREMPGAASIPTTPIAHAIGTMFLGTELLDGLDPERHHADQIFGALESLAELLDDLLATPLLEMLAPSKPDPA